MFQLFVTGTRVPTRRAGDVVIMDRLGAHRGPAVRAVGHGVLYRQCRREQN